MINDFEISYGKPLPLSEQETIITYDKELDEWNLYTDNPVHARQWERVLIPSDHFPNSKKYHEDTGALIEMDGKINGSVSIRAKQVFSPEEREAQRQRMKQLHKAGKLS